MLIVRRRSTSATPATGGVLATLACERGWAILAPVVGPGWKTRTRNRRVPRMDTMSSRRLIGHGLAALVMGVIAVGCAKNPKNNPTDAKTGQPADARAVEPAQLQSPTNATRGAPGEEPQFNTAEALKRKTAAYSQQMESMIDRGPTDGATTRPAMGM